MAWRADLLFQDFWRFGRKFWPPAALFNIENVKGTSLAKSNQLLASSNVLGQEITLKKTVLKQIPNIFLILGRADSFGPTDRSEKS